MYLGVSSRGVETRKVEHIKQLLKGNHSNKTLQNLYDECNGEVEVRLIKSLKTENTLLKFFYEALYNSMMNPVANKCIISQGRNRVILQRTDKAIAGELIKVIDDLV
ncbi:hypothetical protein [Clostridium sp. BNL1100]|uniref:hypothetical protein n=1 Tax=Clostridium sp. BNL1100 TaxID=755731 RepID=UPI00024A7A9D|nr:hypothetical protein [Clostridium sp. BNL1100]AEY66613.1 hypothetical protein Clo1100_2442 [Clostridium sp. BNL1100]